MNEVKKTKKKEKRENEKEKKYVMNKKPDTPQGWKRETKERRT